MAKSAVALCEGCGATATLFELQGSTWQLLPNELEAFLNRHKACVARLGNRPAITIEVVES